MFLFIWNEKFDVIFQKLLNWKKSVAESMNEYKTWIFGKNQTSPKLDKAV